MSDSSVLEDRRVNSLSLFVNEIEKGTEDIARGVTKQLKAITKAMKAKTELTLEHATVQCGMSDTLRDSASLAAEDLRTVQDRCAQVSEAMHDLEPLKLRVREMKQALSFLESLVPIVLCEGEEEKARLYAKLLDSERYWEMRRLELQKAYDNK